MLLWLDIETTGLNPREDAILEVGIIATADNLQEIWRVSKVCRYYGSWEHVHPAVVEMHTKSGLRAETAAREMSERTGKVVERELVTILMENRVVDADGKPISPLCGSTVGFDRSFLKEQMPVLLSCFHYRNIDVSTLTELARRWYPAVYEARPGADESKKPHCALEDLEYSIACLRYYREMIFKAA